MLVNNAYASPVKRHRYREQQFSRSRVQIIIRSNVIQNAVDEEVPTVLTQAHCGKNLANATSTAQAFYIDVHSSWTYVPTDISLPVRINYFMPGTFALQPQ